MSVDSISPKQPRAPGALSIAPSSLRPASSFAQAKAAAFAPKDERLSSGKVGPDGRLDPALERQLIPVVRALLEGNPAEVHTNPAQAKLKLLGLFGPVTSTGPATQPSAWEVHRLRLSHDHDRYPYLRAEVTETDRDGSRPREVRLRTNGRAAFLDSTFNALQDRSLQQRKFRFAFLGQGFIGTADQAKLVLDSLDERPTLSRVMSSAEMEVWRTGEPWRLESSFVEGGTHFGLNEYHFNRQRPYRFDVPRDLLSRLYDKGQLVVNTYPDARVSPTGMSAEARAPFGLEVELVVLGEGRRRLQPCFAQAELADS